jgi:pyruvate/2-oxoglutarate dehydrogenase complex dihydrolipoamide acyltransferase (E2) component
MPRKWSPVMRSPILMPDVGNDAPAFNLWFARPGEHVFAGDRIAELLLEGAIVDICAPADGRLVGTIARPGQRFTPGHILGWIEVDDSEATAQA